VAASAAQLVSAATDFPGGGMGLNLPIPAMASVDAQARFFFYAMFGLAALTFAATLVTTYSKLGFGLRCIQQNEAAADMLRLDTTFYKVSGFAVRVFVGMASGVRLVGVLHRTAGRVRRALLGEAIVISCSAAQGRYSGR
jgi:ABC-type branched-subunit amino acid transport system permease subunit